MLAAGMLETPPSAHGRTLDSRLSLSLVVRSTLARVRGRVRPKSPRTYRQCAAALAVSVRAGAGTAGSSGAGAGRLRTARTPTHHVGRSTCAQARAALQPDAQG